MVRHCRPISSAATNRMKKTILFRFLSYKQSTLMKQNRIKIFWTILLISAPAWSGPGYVVSRANCNNNESFTWDPWVFEPHWRRTLSRHDDTATGTSHTISSSSGLVHTWRSAAVHWGEGRPTTVSFLVPYEVTVPCSDIYDLGCTWTFTNYRWVYYQIPTAFVVTGTHFERLTGETRIKRTTTVTRTCSHPIGRRFY